MSSFWISPRSHHNDWWSSFDRPSRLFDQHFGLGLTTDDILPPVVRTPFFSEPRRAFTRQQSGISEVQVDKDKFQVMLDVQQFSPNEIVVKVVDRTIIVEGKHEEKQDAHGYISRHFVRKYLLPDGAEPKDVISALSTDSVLTVTVPKHVLQIGAANEIVVPIQQTGIPSVNGPAPVSQINA